MYTITDLSMTESLTSEEKKWWSTSKRGCMSTPSEINVYSQWCPALLIPGSKLNGRNTPGACPYCNSQPLKKIADQKKTWICFTWVIFNVKVSWYMVTKQHELEVNNNDIRMKTIISWWRDILHGMMKGSNREFITVGVCNSHIDVGNEMLSHSRC